MKAIALFVLLCTAAGSIGRYATMGLIWSAGRALWGDRWEHPIDYRERPITTLMRARYAYDKTFRTLPNGKV